jgi:hypothetical protein
MVIVDKFNKECKISDVAIPGDTCSRITSKEDEKVEKYEELRQEIIRMWQLTKVDVVPIVVGALGAVTDRIDQWIERMGIEVRVEHLQKTVLLGTARILRKHLNAS